MTPERRAEIEARLATREYKYAYLYDVCRDLLAALDDAEDSYETHRANCRIMATEYAQCRAARDAKDAEIETLREQILTLRSAMAEHAVVKGMTGNNLCRWCEYCAPDHADDCALVSTAEAVEDCEAELERAARAEGAREERERCIEALCRVAVRGGEVMTPERRAEIEAMIDERPLTTATAPSR